MNLHELCARTHFFERSGFCGQILFGGHGPIFSPGYERYNEIAADPFPNGFHYCLSFFNSLSVSFKGSAKWHVKPAKDIR